MTSAPWSSSSTCFSLNFALFPLAPIVFGGLLITAAVRRDLMSLVLAALIVTNAAVTALLFMQASDPNLVQLRYNMRAIPLALIGAAWIFYLWRKSPMRWGVWVATALDPRLSLPSTYLTMKTYTLPVRGERLPARARDGEDQEGNIGIGGYPIGIADEQAMADFIEENVPEDEMILTDDAQSLGIMLLSGRPDLFFDRIDRGDEVWRPGPQRSLRRESTTSW